jgi:hypothetical protein
MSDTSVTTAPAPAPVTVSPPAASTSKPAPVARRWTVHGVLKALASLQLTVVLFTLSLLLVFFGTLAQIDAGMWTVVNDYFRSAFVWIPFQLLIKFGVVFLGLPRTWHVPGAFPFPGGWLLGTALLLNLVAAHAVRFKLSGRRAGILLIHSGLIVMMLGELVTGLFAIEGNMVIDEGKSANFVIENRKTELAVVSSVEEDGKVVDRVTVVPAGLLRKAGATVSHDDLPFDIEVVKYMVNSDLADAAKGEDNLATAGFGKETLAVEKPEEAGTSTKQKVETPAAYLKLTAKDGKELGTYLMAVGLKTQPIEVAGKTYRLSLRPKRTYKPYSLELIKFSFDRYPGTNKPQNYSSEVRLHDEERGEDREVLIKMNDPLRHRGETFYQVSFDEETEKTTVLQVVRNPGWLMPYFSCAIVSVGMIVHFGIHLLGFLRRRYS